jgi:hypothetical protein
LTYADIFEDIDFKAGNPSVEVDASVAQPGRSLAVKGSGKRPPRKIHKRAAGRGFKPRPRLHIAPMRARPPQVVVQQKIQAGQIPTPLTL